MNKKRAGILTFHDADNLGAVLQAYALCRFLNEQCGVSAEIIDYKCEKITETKYASKDKGLKGFLKYIIKSVYYAIKRRGFNRFRKNRLDLSKKIYTKNNIKSCADSYDMFITGSDQVWNPECSGEDKTYVLDFVNDSAKKYSYAASIGNREFTRNDETWIRHMSDYKGLSVREKSAAKRLADAGVEGVKVHSDPVTLLAEEEWKTVMSKRLVASSYVLVYLVLPDVNVMKRARAYAQKNNLKLISNKKSIEFILHNSPADFLSWIYNAEYVFTNSFHGTAFSLIFNKPLFADIEMGNGVLNSRVKDYLEAVDCSACSGADAEIYDYIDKAKEKIEEMRKSAAEYLKEICEA